MVRGEQTRWFVAGLFVGAALSAAAATVVGVAAHDLLGPPATLALCGVAAAYLCAARATGRLPVPQNARQVPAWMTEGHPVGFGIFGVEMGTGARTFSPTALPHLLVLSLVVLAQPLAAVAAAAGFGLGRALAVPIYRRRTRGGVGFRFRVPRALEVALVAGWLVVVPAAAALG